jgi:hypothetical protein
MKTVIGDCIPKVKTLGIVITLLSMLITIAITSAAHYSYASPTASATTVTMLLNLLKKEVLFSAHKLKKIIIIMK